MTLSLESLLYTKNNLIGIGPDLSEQERLDVQLLLDHADDFASRFLDREELWKSWLDRFRNRLEKHGCVKTDVLALPPQVIKDYDDFATKVAPIGTGNTATQLAQLAGASMQQLRISAHAKKFLQSGWKNDVASSFLVTPCQKDETGQIHLAVYDFRFNGSVEIRDFGFWSETQRDIVVWNIGTAYRFDVQRFAGFREQIRKELASRRLQAVTRIEL
ncbi:hypothetical protein ACVWZT_000033 [Pseudomonas sp. TE21394]